MKRSIEKLRFEYGNHPLLEQDLLSNPIDQFGLWFDDAIKAKILEPNGMVLSTVTPMGHPSSRTVLLKSFDDAGLIFFTSYRSRKAAHLERCPFASATFWWKEVFRQVCIEGKVEKIFQTESEDYFAMRPRGAQIATIVCHQSSPLASREEMEQSFLELQKKYEGREIPCPSYWGGYKLCPERFEFWQGRENRLHDRFLYVFADGQWMISRLAP
jgi:pyridoxamine 5'-phosphate oxidase